MRSSIYRSYPHKVLAARSDGKPQWLKKKSLHRTRIEGNIDFRSQQDALSFHLLWMAPKIQRHEKGYLIDSKYRIQTDSFLSSAVLSVLC